MKIFKLASIGLLAVALSVTASAQDRIKNDVTVSPHNYKHPNKAAMKPQAGITFREGKRQMPTIISYREQQRRGGVLEGSITVPARRVATTPRNYKQQNRAIDRVRTQTQATAVNAVPTTGDTGN